MRRSGLYSFTKPVVLLSGGADSLTLATDIILNPHRYRHNTELPALIHFMIDDRVHRHVSDLVRTKQIPYLERIAGKKLERYFVNLDRTLIFKKPKKPTPRNTPVTSFDMHRSGLTPTLHLTMLSIAFNYAASIRANRVYAAFLMDPQRWKDYYENGPDHSEDTPNFVENFNAFAHEGGTVDNVFLIAPFLDAEMSKTSVLMLAEQLEVPLEITHTCVWSINECGKCNACFIYKQGCKELGHDPRRK